MRDGCALCREIPEDLREQHELSHQLRDAISGALNAFGAEYTARTGATLDGMLGLEALLNETGAFIASCSSDETGYRALIAECIKFFAVVIAQPSPPILRQADSNQEIKH